MKNTFLKTLFILFGITCTTYSQDQYTFLGPSGGTGGKPFNDQPLLPDESKVIEVRIRHAKFIDAIQFVHKTKLGRFELNKHGGPGGKEDVFYLQLGEYITEITGKSGKYVDSLKICTNLSRCSPEYGGHGGVSYYYKLQDYEIVGILGREGKLIDAIGVVLRKR